ncbi:MAG: flagellar export protein FliJ [Nitrospinota bacterium]
MFFYKLQVPLEVRKRLEDKERVEYAAALKEVVREKGDLGDLKEKYGDTAKAFTHWQQEGVSMEIIKLFRPFFNRLKMDQRLKGASIEKKIEEAEAKRVLLSEAMKKRRALEILKEKKRLHYFRDRERNEQKVTDESAANFYLRRKNEA